MSEYEYNSLMMEYYNNYKNNIYKSSKELDISETVSILKQKIKKIKLIRHFRTNLMITMRVSNLLSNK